MAKLRVAYGLCPLIDQSSLLGVSDDCMPGCVIVTIGRNIVIRYRLQDQKQVGSWSSKDKLSSAVIYDPVGCQFAAVFNHNQLRLWKENDEQLDKVKKYKFEEGIHCIIPQSDGDPAVVLFRNGCVALLAAAVESRKEAISGPILQRDETITDYYCVSNMGRKFITFVTRDAKDAPTLNVVPIVLGESAQQYPLHRDDTDGIRLVGHAVLQMEDSCSILTLWSDGQLFSFPFLPMVQEQFPGSALLTVSALCCMNPVQMVTLEDKHLALFGSDPGEEGATMLLLNLQFRLIQSRLHFKLYSKPPRLFKVRANLLVAVGNSLVVVPYRLDTERLASLIGSHTRHPCMEHAIWFSGESDDMEVVEQVPHEIKEQISSLRRTGSSEAAIAHLVLPQVIEKKQVKCLTWCLQHFTDIPEDCLAQILTFCLLEPDSTFLEAETNTDDTREEEGTLSPSSRAKLLRIILDVPFSEAGLVPHIRLMPFTQIVELLHHLCCLVDVKGTTSQERVLEWISLLLDAHYQQYLLSHDPKVLKLLMKLKDLVNEQLNYTEELKKLAPVLHRVNAGRLPVTSQAGNQRYTIELLQLY
ncbi:nucleolar protein 11 [Anabrus simplex]|uniref:nucleolar protein 11 n=1 Tax=Anabrus simplex TaxID=316456 RepID=UPI0035A27858